MISEYQPPVVDAGDAQNITVNHANLVGTADAYRGDIASQVWTCVSFPAGAIVAITTPAALATAVTGLTIDGVYRFKLTAKDSNDFSNSATIDVTVALA